MNPAWLSSFEESLQKEFGDRPRAFTLANVDSAGTPQARSVICRHMDATGALWFCCDARSEKALDLLRAPAVACVFWLASLRLQYRINGKATGYLSDLNMPQRVEMWKALSDRSRAMFFWPAPGSTRDDDGRKLPESSNDPHPPDTFEVARIDPNMVDLLDLKPHPHRRTRWIIQDRLWIEQPLNP